MTRSLTKVLGALLITYAAASADQISFRNGEHVTGKLVSVSSGIITFHSESLGLLQVSASKDLTISADRPVTIKLSNGKNYQGNLRPSTDTGWILATQDNTQLVSIAPEEVVAIESTTPEEIAVAQKSVTVTESRENVWENANDRPRLTGPWSVDSRIAFSGVYSSKNRQLLHWNGELDRSSSLGNFKFSGERIYSVSTNQSGKTFTDDDLTRGEAQYSKDLTQRTSVTLGFEGLHDEARYIDKRLMVSADLRYRLFDSKKVKITPFVGPGWIHYSYLPNKGVTPSPLSFEAIQFGFAATFHLPGKLEITQEFSFNQGYRADGTYLSHTDLRVRRPITRWLYLDGKISDDFDSRSAYQASPNTFRYSAGIGVKFDAF